MTTPDILLIGASGTAGRLTAVELAARGARLVLAGRDPGRLAATAAALPPGSPAPVLLPLDLDDPAALAAAVGSARLVLNTVGPFARLAGAVIDACLAAGTPYVDLANELTAVRSLLARDSAARARGVTLVTGAGFGPAVTEALVLRLRERAGAPLARVEVASAAVTAYATEGVRTTVAEALADGTAYYASGRLEHAPLGTGLTTLRFGGAERRMLPVPVGDLETAHRASGGAGSVTAYAPAPGSPATAGVDSFAYARAVDRAGRPLTAELRCGEGFAVSAAIAAGTALRVLADGAPGAWTPGALYGPALVEAAGCTVTLDAGARRPQEHR
ncbi:saccharopine dehydrogenase NADP-binding domain-containing protein [Kitasatospora sp. NPDC094015]|uniref:saccharopine dehydrogenase NADP-binding domain-containing protein n=1 Tax=Kitasatospora sp. NPDC094015 TaxID=3155205 RepID=UPI00331E26E4